MEPQVRTSFIPKKPITASSARGRGGVGLFSLLTVIIFVVSVFAAGGVFGYEQYLKRAIVSKSESLSRAREAYEPAVIQELIRLDSRMKLATEVLTSHISASAIFDLLERVTLETVRYKSFEFSLDGERGAVFALDGEARSFSDVALQSDAFSKERGLKDLIFRDIDLNDTGRAVFSISANIDASILRYENNLTSSEESPEQAL